MIRIICYGDSNTWGYNAKTAGRFDENTRWTGILQKQLGQGYQVVEAGLNGRTTSFDDFYRDYENGRRGLCYSLLENKPIDLLIISLGINDLKFSNAYGSSKGLLSLLQVSFFPGAFNIEGSGYSTIYQNEPKVLVVSPIHLAPDIDAKCSNELLHGKYEESCRLAEFYQPVCEKFGAEFLDASLYAGPGETDGIHMDEEGHKALADAVYRKVVAILGEVQSNHKGSSSSAV